MSAVMIVLFVFWVLLLVRNHMVFRERMRMIDLIFRVPMRDNWEQLHQLQDTVSQNRMVLCFWVWPIRKMWPTKLRELL